MAVLSSGRTKETCIGTEFGYVSTPMDNPSDMYETCTDSRDQRVDAGVCTLGAAATFFILRFVKGGFKLKVKV